MKETNILKKIKKNSFKKDLKKSKKNIPLLNNRYYLEEEVGRGGLSIVYKASDIYCDYFNENSNIVIKIPTDELLKKDDISAFVYAEYNFLKKLSNKNIVKVLDFGIDKKTNIPYIVLEHIKGSLLSELPISQMNKKFKNNIFKSLLSTIEYIHSQNIVHADINPYNIITKGDDFLIFDFGISQFINDNNKFNLEYNKVKAYNPKYCAPEVLQGEKPTINSDIFSFACIMYEIYTCSKLFEKDSLELLEKPLSKEKFRKIPLLLRPWFKRALSKNPEKRKIKTILLKLF